MEIIDAWAQHPTPRHTADNIFDSLRRWTKTTASPDDPQLPVEATINQMDKANIRKALISAWYAPRNVMISNDEVASFVEHAPDRLAGVGSVDLSKPMEAVAEVKRCVNELGFKAIRVLPWLWEVPPPTGGSIRFTLPAVSLAFRSARKLATLAHSCRPRWGVPSIWIRSRWIFQNW